MHRFRKTIVFILCLLDRIGFFCVEANFNRNNESKQEEDIFINVRDGIENRYRSNLRNIKRINRPYYVSSTNKSLNQQHHLIKSRNIQENIQSEKTNEMGVRRTEQNNVFFNTLISKLHQTPILKDEIISLSPSPDPTTPSGEISPTGGLSLIDLETLLNVAAFIIFTILGFVFVLLSIPVFIALAAISVP